MNDRKILFRGFHPDENGTTTITLNGDKVKGEWIKWDMFGHSEETFNRKGTAGENILVHFVMPCDVIPQTIGQWVTADKNGKDLFEGDRVRWSPEGGKVCRGVVEYLEDCGCFVVGHDDYSSRCDYMNDYKYELTGNAWEVAE